MSESCRGLNDHFERCLPVKPCVVQCGLIQTGTHVERRPAQNLPRGWEWALFEDFCQSGETPGDRSRLGAFVVEFLESGEEQEP